MPKLLAGSVLLLATIAAQGATVAISDNDNALLSLSGSNYNRLLVPHDKIMEAVFPPEAMAIRRDEQDGSVYVLLNRQEPFTLFLTTESGRHFSLTVSGEDSLGKTIELRPKRIQVAAPAKKPAAVHETSNTALTLLEQMKTSKKVPGVAVRKVYGKAIRLSQGLTLLLREQWSIGELSGEALEVYNGGNKPLTLSSSDFIAPTVKAAALSQSILPPKGRAMLYRVSEVAHG